MPSILIINQSKCRTERHVIFPEDPHVSSLASLMLLKLDFDPLRFLSKSILRKKQWRFNEKFLYWHLKTFGILQCYYCGKTDLIIACKEKNKLATADHFHPIGKNGSAFKRHNLVVACNKCNQKKKDSIYLRKTLKFIPANRHDLRFKSLPALLASRDFLI